ncbi:nucleotide exchange factor GrpE [Chiayiivirga flava]|uniref:Protein GrpE n=1 Tax=Chiayiivirga flava TaxID=659595 RepID=A0A7W8FY07_9GAMM|nr:nucleotide exchange factor GrpE [Chiayiivirga flava]MBB5206902.1 molecular chaperone GrpE [Chiayiivirga flava]
MHSNDTAPAPTPDQPPRDDGFEPSLEDRIADLEQQLGAARDEQLRDRADLENQRRRLIRDVEQARKFANERLLADLLPVLDSLEAGLAAEGEPGKLREGMELTLRQLLRVAQGNGLNVVDPTGGAFNPEHHQAISTVPSAEHAPGHVVQVYQKGYVLNDRLLRPALVVVAQDG